ncbi:hypothetical protein EYF80_066042 [Liparis tanakae]|uniref:Uncharacterized protein n=1 Tax=Liparis tanakae TaxID=230148 RepID=A0A4Z2E4J5_9TELE|nr:hypothetical protein EYF80_066042 [Liparis tanakae]
MPPTHQICTTAHQSVGPTELH